MQQSRAEQLVARGVAIELPEAPAHLVRWLQELGWCMANGMGLVGLPASEIRAWACGCGHKPNPLEFESLAAASRAYANEHQAEGPEHDDVPPDGQDIQKPRPTSAFSSLAKKVNRKK